MSKARYSKIALALVLCICITSIASAATFKETSDNVLDNQVSGTFGQLTGKIFQTSDTSLNNVIVMYVLFVVVLLILLEVMSLVPFFESKPVAVIVSIIVSLLIALSGAYSAVSAGIVSFTQPLSEKLGTFAALIILVAIFSLIGFMLRNVISHMKLAANKTKSFYDGFTLAKDVALDNLERRTLGD